ncbi:hypothetical protein [Rubritalea tangerina]|uniref:Sulfatase-modifying factor enzyme domain-containing protein n=1 Tax=Rubritalea tangerina TaxID=430798 RepID=A0ABW4ZCD7_9BACT
MNQPLQLLRIFLMASLLLGAAHAQRLSSPTAARDPFQKQSYPWKKNITATIFWIGEEPTAKNPTPNHASSWDTKWEKNYGGFDDPNPAARTYGYRPIAFRPKQNPFYIALPYNDRIDWRRHKPEASKVIPWFHKYQPKPGKTVLKGRWLQIVHGRKVCYAQWEDCGPFCTDDWRYVFGNARPKNKKNNGAGIDVSPAVRDYLGLKSGGKVHWRFIDFENVPKGPWSKFGDNNPFINPSMDRDLIAKRRYMEYLRRQRDKAHGKQS